MQQLSEIVQLLQNKQFDQAVRHCEFALSSSNHPQIHLFKAIALGELGKIEESKTIFLNLLNHFPQNLEIQFNFALVLEKNSLLENAVIHFQNCLKLDPNHFPACRKLAFISFQIHNYPLALEATKKCLQFEANNPDFHNLLGLIYLDLKQTNSAIKSFEKAKSLAGKSLEFSINLATACALSGQQDKLEQELESIAAYNTPDALKFVASMHEKSNQIQEAKKYVDLGLKLSPQDSELIFIDAKIKKENKKLEESLNQINLIKDFPNEIFHHEVLYEKAKILDKLKQYDQAWETATIANSLSLNSWQQSNPEPDNYNKAYKEISDSLKSRQGSKIEEISHSIDKKLCFIFGFTRSGTTLLDSVLSSHSEVSVLEEIPLIRDLTQQFPKTSPSEQYAKMMDISEEQKISLRNRYFDLIPKYLELPKTSLIIDKSPLNTSLVGFIKNVFPESKMIFSIRHPLDVCVSCFFQQFEFNSYMTNMVSPEKIARTYDAVMNVWFSSIKAFDIDVHYQKYEELITDFEPQTRSLINYLELDWEEGMESYNSNHKQRAIIPNPSYNQVNQPIYQSAKYRYKNYMKHLELATEILRPWIDKFEYEV